MKITFFACSGRAIIDQVTNNLTLVDLIEDRAAEGFPVLVPITAVTGARRESGEPSQVEATIRFKLDKVTLFEGPANFDFQDEKSTRTLVTLQGLIIPGPGVLSVSMHMDGKRVANWETNWSGPSALSASSRTVPSD